MEGYTCRLMGKMGCSHKFTEPLKVVVEREFDSFCGNFMGFLQLKGMVKSTGESSGMGY